MLRGEGPAALKSPEQLGAVRTSSSAPTGLLGLCALAVDSLDSLVFLAVIATSHVCSG